MKLIFLWIWQSLISINLLLTGMSLQDLLVLIWNRDLLDHYKGSVRILGQTSLLKPDVLTHFLQVQEMTKNNKGAILNVCCPYTSREEITHSLREIVAAVEMGELDAEDIDEATIEKNLYTKDCPRPDLLIRTSGVKRLSDFLLWQVTPLHPSLFCVCGVLMWCSVIRIRRLSLWIVIGLNLRFGSLLVCCWSIRFHCFRKELQNRIRSMCPKNGVDGNHRRGMSRSIMGACA